MVDLIIFDKFLETFRVKKWLRILRRLFDLLLSANISSYFFEKYYYKYVWIDISDYKSILDFLIKGGIIIPLSIFLVVHIVLLIIPRYILNLIRNRIVEFLKKYYLTPKKKLKVFLKLKDTKEFRQLLKGRNKEKNEVEEISCFVFKLIITSIFYFIILKAYNSVLFIIVIVLLIVTLVALYFVYLIIDLVPPALKKLQQDVEQLTTLKSSDDNQNLP